MERSSFPLGDSCPSPAPSLSSRHAPAQFRPCASSSPGALLLAASAPAFAKIPVIFASSTDTNEQNYTHLTIVKLMELAQKYSDNTFDFQLFPGMQLGDEQETVRAMQLGTVHITALATNNFAPFAPSCGWVNMPYLFNSLEEFRDRQIRIPGADVPYGAVRGARQIRVGLGK